MKIRIAKTPSNFPLLPDFFVNETFVDISHDKTIVMLRAFLENDIFVIEANPHDEIILIPAYYKAGLYGLMFFADVNKKVAIEDPYLVSIGYDSTEIDYNLRIIGPIKIRKSNKAKAIRVTSAEELDKVLSNYFVKIYKTEFKDL